MSLTNPFKPEVHLLCSLKKNSGREIRGITNCVPHSEWCSWNVWNIGQLVVITNLHYERHFLFFSKCYTGYGNQAFLGPLQRYTRSLCQPVECRSNMLIYVLVVLAATEVQKIKNTGN